MLKRIKKSVENLIKRGISYACANFLNGLFTIQSKVYSNRLFSSSFQPASRGILLRMQSRRAAALAELGLAMPVLVVFVTLTYQVWKTIEINRMLDTTARDAARFASLQIPPMSNITPLVDDYVRNKLVPNSKLAPYQSKIWVKLERLGGSPAGPEDTAPPGIVNQSDVLKVSVNLRANEPGGFYSFLVGPSTTNIVRSAAYAQQNPIEGTVEPTPTPVPTDETGCCVWFRQVCVNFCDCGGDPLVACV